MSKLKFYDVYDGGRQQHPGSAGIMDAVKRYEDYGEMIGDATAQAIASWFYDAKEPYTTRLSTMGKVDRYADREHFATDAELSAMDADDKRALTALMYYVHRKQTDAESGYRPCACDDCMDTAIGRPGELCESCSEAGCSATEHDMCEREDAYDSDGHPQDCSGTCCEDAFAPDPREVTDGLAEPSYCD